MKKPDPVINLEVLREPHTLRLVKAWLPWSPYMKREYCPFFGRHVCVCQELFSDNHLGCPSHSPCPCDYYGADEVHLAVKKAVEEIEREER